MEAFGRADLLVRQLSADRPYLEFLRSESMSIGLYVLDAGATDGQAPHHEDEVYVVLAGRSRFTAGDQTRDVEPDHTIYVAAGVPHKFHDITERLELIVVFAPPQRPADVARRNKVATRQLRPRRRPNNPRIAEAQSGRMSRNLPPRLVKCHYVDRCAHLALEDEIVLPRRTQRWKNSCCLVRADFVRHWSQRRVYLSCKRQVRRKAIVYHHGVRDGVFAREASKTSREGDCGKDSQDQICPRRPEAPTNDRHGAQIEDHVGIQQAPN